MSSENVIRNANLSTEELKKLTKEEIHNKYKESLCQMIFTFSMHFTQYLMDIEDDIEKLKTDAVKSFVIDWVDQHIAPARKDWNPHEDNC